MSKLTQLRSGEAGIKAKFQLRSRVSAVNHEALPRSMFFAPSSSEDTLSSLINLFEVLID